MEALHNDNGNLLCINDLYVSFKTYGGRVRAVRGVTFDVKQGECVAVVGESGCGKSVTAKSILRLIQASTGSIDGGSIVFEGKDVLSYSEKAMQSLRGDAISMIFQDPMTSLNPTMTIGKQISEVLRKHQHMSKAEAMERTIEYLKLVGIANPQKRVKEYPDSLSGGMRQRVVIAIAMCCNPRLLIADEPTTALDVTIQAQILELMKGLQEKFNTSIILITHDLGVVANMASRVLVFYAGKIVEQGTVDEIFYQPRHPYTWGLLKSMPRVNSTAREPLISIDGTPPDLFAPPKGCAFAARCEHALNICTEAQPPMIDVGVAHAQNSCNCDGCGKNGHFAACWLNRSDMPAEYKPKWMSNEHVTQDDMR